jgi:hypothetical protein
VSTLRASIIQQPAPLERIREALDWAALKGIAVEPGGDGYGVRATVIGGARRWVREHAGGFVSPLGAVVLREQPLAGMMPEAAAEAMGVGVPWIVGFNAGCRRENLPASWLAGFSAGQALAGYEVGTQIRAWLLSAYCAKHATRYSRIGGSCGACDVEASTRGDELPARGGDS